ncbi:hypothetical protein F5X97DRAFT_15922 [Nemania serpens]|nr:hypothetical protein F5X97DRAFT_15922 [Nemania serpens]
MRDKHGGDWQLIAAILSSMLGGMASGNPLRKTLDVSRPWPSLWKRRRLKNMVGARARLDILWFKIGSGWSFDNVIQQGLTGSFNGIAPINSCPINRNPVNKIPTAWCSSITRKGISFLSHDSSLGKDVVMIRL